MVSRPVRKQQDDGKWGMAHGVEHTFPSGGFAVQYRINSEVHAALRCEPR
jgi:hypothetical protein